MVYGSEKSGDVQIWNLQRLVVNSPQQIVDCIRSVVKEPCVLSAPVFRGNEVKYLKECIDTGWVSSVGSFVDRVGSELAEYTGAAYAIPTVNGTSALHASLLLVGVRPGEEVIVPALSFVATANAVAYCGSYPHFVDVSEETLGMDPVKLSNYLESVLEPSGTDFRNKVTGRRVAAVVPMHTFGHPCEIEEICEIARRFGLPVVEDAAESLGSFKNGQHTGTFGLVGTLSFNGNKIVTAGGGGAILTNDETLAKKAKHLTTTAKLPHSWEFQHDQVGYNYRMPNINAALLCGQLECLKDFLKERRGLLGRYKSAFANIEDAHLVEEPTFCSSNHWLIAIRLRRSLAKLRDEVLRLTNEADLMTRPCWTPLNRLEMFSNCPSAPLNATNLCYDQIVCIPSSVGGV